MPNSKKMGGTAPKIPAPANPKLKKYKFQKSPPKNKRSY